MLCLHQAGEELTPAREEVAGSLLDTPCDLGESCLTPRIEATELVDEPVRYPSDCSSAQSPKALFLLRSLSIR